MKKILSITLVVVLLAGMAVTGTMAYLQDTDSDVNVMTLGKVSIEQHEYERAVDADGKFVTYIENERDDKPTGYKLTDFTQAKPLYPAVGTAEWDQTKVYFAQLPDDSTLGTQSVFAKPENAQDKFVFVENTGKSDAYVRTIAAFEIGTAKNVIGGANTDETNLIMMNYNGVGWTRNFIGEATIDGNNYYIVEFVYDGVNSTNGKHPDGIVHPGEYTYCSLAQIYMTPKATNEDVEAIDGNKNGTYDILVLSQAVQVEGFADATTALDTAFGDVTAEKAAEWFGGEGFAIPKILVDVIGVNDSTNKSGTFVLGNDIKTSGNAAVTSNARYGFGYEYIIRKGVDYTLNLNGKTIKHEAVNENANNNALTYLFIANNAGTKLTIEGEGKVYCNNSEGYTCAIQGKDGTLVTVNGGDYEVDNGIAVWAGAGSHIVINGGSFVNGNAKTDHELIYTSGGVIDIYGGFFHNTDGNYTLNVEDRNRATGFINVYGGTYVNFDPSTGGQDPNNIKVAAGYKVVSENRANGDIWYTVVPE